MVAKRREVYDRRGEIDRNDYEAYESCEAGREDGEPPEREGLVKFSQNGSGRDAIEMT